MWLEERKDLLIHKIVDFVVEEATAEVVVAAEARDWEKEGD